MKAQAEPFAECPKCHEYTLRIATKQEKIWVRYFLVNEVYLIGEHDDLESQHLVVCNECGLFESIYGLPWDEWQKEFLKILRKGDKRRVPKLEKLWWKLEIGDNIYGV